MSASGSISRRGSSRGHDRGEMILGGVAAAAGAGPRSLAVAADAQPAPRERIDRDRPARLLVGAHPELPADRPSPRVRGKEHPAGPGPSCSSRTTGHRRAHAVRVASLRTARSRLPARGGRRLLRGDVDRGLRGIPPQCAAALETAVQSSRHRGAASPADGRTLRLHPLSRRHAHADRDHGPVQGGPGNPWRGPTPVVPCHLDGTFRAAAGPPAAGARPEDR